MFLVLLCATLEAIAVLAAVLVKKLRSRFVIGAGAVATCAAFVLAFVARGKFDVFLWLAPALVVVGSSLEAGLDGFAGGATLACTFFLGSWSGALVRQLFFEVHTSGHVTGSYDSCTAALMPLIVIGILGIVFLCGAGGSVLRLRFGRPLLVAALIAFTAGSFIGASTWRDWQVNNPCL